MTSLDVEIPGWEGSIGPGPGQYNKQAAPGVPIPDHLRS